MLRLSPDDLLRHCQELSFTVRVLERHLADLEAENARLREHQDDEDGGTPAPGTPVSSEAV
jgi:hypothetical protein